MGVNMIGVVDIDNSTRERRVGSDSKVFVVAWAPAVRVVLEHIQQRCQQAKGIPELCPSFRKGRVRYCGFATREPGNIPKCEPITIYRPDAIHGWFSGCLHNESTCRL